MHDCALTSYLTEEALNTIISTPQRLNIINALLFQANWFICIFMSSSVAAFTTLTLLLLHYKIFSRDKAEWFLILAFASLGFSCDSVIQLLGVMSFSQALSLSYDSNLALAPLWLLFLWISFATCLNHCLAYLQQRLWLSVVLVIIAIPFNYYMGALMTDSVFLVAETIALFIITVYWAVLLPVFLHFLSKLASPDHPSPLSIHQVTKKQYSILEDSK